jgi:hypothetical protein
MIQNLEPDEIKKLKSELTQGYLFGIAVFILFTILFIYAAKGDLKMDPVMVLAAGIAFTFLIVWLLNGTVYKDLKSGKKEVLEQPIEIHEDERKIKKTMMGALFSAWGSSKKKKAKPFLIHVNNATFEVSKEEVSKAEEKGKIKIHYTLYGRKVLKLEV